MWRLIAVSPKDTVSFPYCNKLLHINSAIHQAARLPAAGRNGLQREFLSVVAIYNQQTFFHSAGIVPVKAMEWQGTMRLATL